MSFKRVSLIIATKHMNNSPKAVSEEFHNTNSNNNYNPNGRPPVVPEHGVNVILGGAMMSGMIITVFVICYCCHKNQQKRQDVVQRYWRYPRLSMEIYTVEGQNQIFEAFDEPIPQPSPVPRHIHSGPPPSYEEANSTTQNNTDKPPQDTEDDQKNHGLPTYEEALRLFSTRTDEPIVARI